jgi:hypothetical protein
MTQRDRAVVFVSHRSGLAPSDLRSVPVFEESIKTGVDRLEGGWYSCLYRPGRKNGDAETLTAQGFYPRDAVEVEAKSETRTAAGWHCEVQAP